jgi:hypothetical protein
MGYVRLAYCNKDATDRPSMEKLIAVLCDMKSTQEKVLS